MRHSAGFARWVVGACVLVGIATPAFGEVVVGKPGTQKSNSNYTCGDMAGTVTVTTGVEFTVKTIIDKSHDSSTHTTNGIAIHVTGPNCTKCKWLQFVWREVLDAGGAHLPARFQLPNLQTYDATMTSTPTYRVDSPSTADPQYEGDAVVRTSNPTPTNTIYDSPSGGDKPHATADKELAHYDTFLICENKVCLKVSWTETFTWDRLGLANDGTYDPVTIDVSGERPNAEQMKQLNEQYKDQKLLK